MTTFKHLLIAAIFASSAFVDAPSYLATGSISLMGVLTIAFALSIGALVFINVQDSLAVLARLWPLSLLFAFSVAQLLWDRFSTQAAQTLCLQWIFLGLIVLMMTAEREGFDGASIKSKLRAASLVAAGIYLVVFLFEGFGSEGIGAISFITARSFALFALLGMALFLADWVSGDRGSLWLAGALILLIALSLSRTALVVSAVLIPLSRIRSFSSSDVKRLLIFGTIAVLILYYLVFSIDALRTRFLGSNSIEDFASGEAAIDTSGRLTAWAVTTSSYVDSPWLGQGPGSANDLVDDVLYRLDLGHPLNEYLRFLHDEGALGLFLLLLGYGQLVRRCWKAYRFALHAESPQRSFYLATFLALVASLLTMFTDNTASYIFVMGPLAIMVGLSLRYLQEQESSSIVAAQSDTAVDLVSGGAQ
jgi:O-antigen ligase